MTNFGKRSALETAPETYRSPGNLNLQTTGIDKGKAFGRPFLMLYLTDAG